MSRNENPAFQQEANAQLDTLIQKAIAFGATEAAIIDPKTIRVEDSLAKRCVDPKCIYYGLAPSCPPHVAGPVSAAAAPHNRSAPAVSGSKCVSPAASPRPR